MLELIIVIWTMVGGLVAYILCRTGAIFAITNPYKKALVVFGCGFLLWLPLLVASLLHNTRRE